MSARAALVIDDEPQKHQQEGTTISLERAGHK